MKTNDILLEILSKSLSKTKGTLYTDKGARKLYSTDASIYMVEPLAVFIPRHEDDLSTLVKVATKLGVGLHPRGGATGLAGESLGRGIVVDMHEAFQDIHLDPDLKTAKVGCGVVLDELNRRAEQYDLAFGPDPSSASRCTIGGMIANNSTGTHSLKYGYTSNHVLSIRMVLFNGEIVDLKPDVLQNQPEVFRKLVPILESYKSEIENSYPNQDRNRCGYNLRQVWDGKIFNPIPLVCGSEATFGIIVSATLSLVKIPKSKALGMFIFENTYEACKAVNDILPFKPAGLELITEHVLKMGLEHDSRLGSIIPEKAEAVLLAEWSGDSDEQVKEQMYPALAKMRWPGASAVEVHEAYDKKSMAVLWLIRKEAEALILNRPGSEKAISFVEDTAISPEKLGEWYRTKENVLKKFKINWATFGHAGSGELHTKLFINVKDNKAYKQMVDMSEVLYDRLIKLGGSISGEHGDGLSRTPYIKKQYPELYPVFVKVKKELDPENIFNPENKIFTYEKHPALMYSRLGGFTPSDKIKPSLYYGDTDFETLSTACHGCGACRNPSTSTTMCPFFKVEDTELSSPRARGNLARLRLAGTFDGEDYTGETLSKTVKSCFNCKMCLMECPSHVDIPHLTLEIKNAEKISDIKKATYKSLGKLDKTLKTASKMAGVTNKLINSAATRWIGKTFYGIDDKLKLFPFDKGVFARKCEQLKQPSLKQKMVFYADYHVIYQNHSLGLSFIRLLNQLGYEVIPFTYGGCGLVAMDIGDFDSARKIIEAQKDSLYQYCEKGLQIVTTEPSAALMLKMEWPYLKDDEKIRRISANVLDSSALLADLLCNNKEIEFAEKPLNVAYHEPCHLKALKPALDTVKLLKTIPGLSVEDLESGCCGMAGVWGMFADNRNLSRQMANALYRKLDNKHYDLALSECSTCRLQMLNSSSDTPVLHPVELIAQTIKPE